VLVVNTVEAAVDAAMSLHYTTGAYGSSGQHSVGYFNLTATQSQAPRD
jgi:hypothetical protein